MTSSSAWKRARTDDARFSAESLLGAGRQDRGAGQGDRPDHDQESGRRHSDEAGRVKLSRFCAKEVVEKIRSSQQPTT